MSPSDSTDHPVFYTIQSLQRSPIFHKPVTDQELFMLFLTANRLQQKFGISVYESTFVCKEEVLGLNCFRLDSKTRRFNLPKSQVRDNKHSCFQTNNVNIKVQITYLEGILKQFKEVLFLTSLNMFRQVLTSLDMFEQFWTS